jgi:rubrerythrin
MNTKFNSTEEILDYAIAKEEEAAEFYSELAKKDLSEETAKVFEDLARIEIKHKNYLKEIKKGKAKLKDENIRSLQIAEITEAAETNADMTIAEALTVAMKRELAAYRLYIELAAAATTYETLDIFVLLAQEEARHRLWFETEYKNAVESPVLGNSN